MRVCEYMCVRVCDRECIPLLCMARLTERGKEGKKFELGKSGVRVGTGI